MSVWRRTRVLDLTRTSPKSVGGRGDETGTLGSSRDTPLGSSIQGSGRASKRSVDAPTISLIRSSSSSVFFASVSSVDVAPPLDANSSKVSAPPSCPFAAPLGLGTADLGLMGLSMSNGSGSPAMVVGVWVGVDSSIHRQRRGGSLARLNVNFNLGRPRRIDDRIFDEKRAVLWAM